MQKKGHEMKCEACGRTDLGDTGMDKLAQFAASIFDDFPESCYDDDFWDTLVSMKMIEAKKEPQLGCDNCEENPGECWHPTDDVEAALRRISKETRK